MARTYRDMRNHPNRIIPQEGEHAVPFTTTAPKSVLAAGVLVGLQGLAGIGVAISLLVRAMTSGEKVPGVDVYAEAGFFAVFAAAVIAVGAGLVLGRRWSRTPAAVLQVLLLCMAWYLVSSSTLVEYGIGGIVLCAVILVLLFTRKGRAWAVTDPAESAESR